MACLKATEVSQPIRPIAFYLPQYHQIPENDTWWGEGITKWTNAAPLYQRLDGQ